LPPHGNSRIAAVGTENLRKDSEPTYNVRLESEQNSSHLQIDCDQVGINFHPFRHACCRQEPSLQANFLSRINVASLYIRGRIRVNSGHSADLDEILVRQRSAGKLSELAADGERSKIDAGEADPVDECCYFRLCCVVAPGIEPHAPPAVRPRIAGKDFRAEVIERLHDARPVGVRLFHRSTRKLTLTEAGERFLHAIRDNLEALQALIASVATDRGEPAGVLKVSLSLTFGVDYILPLLPEFLTRYPNVRPDWQFESRQVDLVAEGVDAAIGGGIGLAPGIVSRTLAPLHIVAVASPDYLKGRTPPTDPSGLAAFDGIVMRSMHTGRIRNRTMRNAAGDEMAVPLKAIIAFDDPEAMCRAALLGLGVTLIAVPHALPHLERGTLVRLVPQWYADAGPISIYYASRTLIPAKTRVFVDFVVEAFRRQRLAERFAGSVG
jgi:DNA-binding transcriptional LysR family regulator